MDPRTTSRSATEPVDSASNPLRVVVADDDTLLREGLMILPHRSGFEVVGQAGDATNLVPLIQDKRPDGWSSTFACRPRIPLRVSSNSSKRANWCCSALSS